MAKILHYLNQFFAGIGGEDKAGQQFLFLPKPLGPGVLLTDLMKNRDIEYGTVVCGDNYFHDAGLYWSHVLICKQDLTSGARVSRKEKARISFLPECLGKSDHGRFVIRNVAKN